MDQITTVGIDTSKRIFHFHGTNSNGKQLLRKKVSRQQFIKTVIQLPKGCHVYMEASRGSHHWSRKIEEYGYKVKQIPAQRVKPFLQSQKNDYNDATAICEAGSRASMKFVPTKSEDQQTIQEIHRIRERLIKGRTQIINQIRGVLAEHGVVLAERIASVRKYLLYDLEQTIEISSITKEHIQLLKLELIKQEEIICLWEQRLKELAKRSELIQRLSSIPGVGLITASALTCAHGNPKEFKNGRQFAAWLGLVPRQWSSGGKDKLLGISKKGNRYIRKLLIHGCRAVVQHANKRQDKHSLWVVSLHQRKGTALTAVALANKNARIAWKLLTSDEVKFDPNLPHAN